MRPLDSGEFGGNRERAVLRWHTERLGFVSVLRASADEGRAGIEDEAIQLRCGIVPSVDDPPCQSGGIADFVVEPVEVETERGRHAQVLLVSRFLQVSRVLDAELHVVERSERRLRPEDERRGTRRRDGDFRRAQAALELLLRELGQCGPRECQLRLVKVGDTLTLPQQVGCRGAHDGLREQVDVRVLRILLEHRGEHPGNAVLVLHTHDRDVQEVFADSRALLLEEQRLKRLFVKLELPYEASGAVVEEFAALSLAFFGCRCAFFVRTVVGNSFACFFFLLVFCLGNDLNLCYGPSSIKHVVVPTVVTAAVITSAVAEAIVTVPPPQRREPSRCAERERAQLCSVALGSKEDARSARRRDREEAERHRGEEDD